MADGPPRRGPALVGQAAGRSGREHFERGCSAPPKSSHQLTLLRPVFARAPVAQRLVRTRLVVPADPRGDLAARRPETREPVLPHTFFFQAAEEALDHAI